MKIHFSLTLLLAGTFAHGAMAVEVNGVEPLYMAQAGPVRCFCGGPVDCPIHRAPSSTGSARRSYSRPSGGGASISVPRLPPSIGPVIPSPWQLQRQTAMKTAGDINEAGLKAAAAGRWDEAIELFRKALDTYPDYDLERTKIRNNIEWAESQKAGLIAQQKESRLALDSAKDFVSRLQSNVMQGYPWGLAVPPQPEPPKVAGGPLGGGPPKTTEEEALAKPAEVRRLQFPACVEESDLLLDAVEASDKLSKAEKDELRKQYELLRKNFEYSWEPLARTYQEYLDANSEWQELRERIERHNAADPGAEADANSLRRYNEEMRLLNYQMFKVKALSEEKCLAFMEAREKFEPQVDRFLASKQLEAFNKKATELLAGQVPARSPGVDPALVAGQVAAELERLPVVKPDAISGMKPSDGLPIIDPAKLSGKGAPDILRQYKEEPIVSFQQFVDGLRKRSIEELDPPVLRNVDARMYDFEKQMLNEKLDKANAKAEELYAKDLETNERRRVNEVLAGVRRLRDAGVIDENKSLSQQIKERPFLQSTLSNIAQQATTQREFRDQVSRKQQEEWLRRERRRIMGYQEHPAY